MYPVINVKEVYLYVFFFFSFVFQLVGDQYLTIVYYFAGQSEGKELVVVMAAVSLQMLALRVVVSLARHWLVVLHALSVVVLATVKSLALESLRQTNMSVVPMVL